MSEIILTNKIEGFNGEILHPSLDVKNEVLVLGFRYKSKSKEDKDLILVMKKGNLEVENGDSFDVDGKEYLLEKRGRKLVWIQDRWSLEDFNRFREDYASFKPDAVPEGKALFQEIKGLVQRYVELEENVDYDLAVTWSVGTYFFPIFSAYPFLNVKAPKRSGKSQFLNTLQQICFNATKARPTVAALGDTVDSHRGTYLIDQADSLNNRGNEDLLDLLADSYKRGGGKRSIMLVDKGKRHIIELEVYSPKVFASIRELPEDLRDRCVIMPLIRSQRNFLDPYEDSGVFAEVRAKIYRFLISQYSNVGAEYVLRKTTYKQNRELIGRTLELWQPIEVILRCMGQETIVPEAKKRFLSLYGFTEYEPSDLDAAVIQALLGMFGSENEIVVSPKTISESVPVELFPDKANVTRRSAMVGWIIKKFNVPSEKKTRTKEGMCYRFEKKKVERAYTTYFPTSPTSKSENPQNTGDFIDVGSDAII